MPFSSGRRCDGWSFMERMSCAPTPPDMRVSFWTSNGSVGLARRGLWATGDMGAVAGPGVLGDTGAGRLLVCP
ncbi:MAG: hypothetical protein JWO49_885 [Arthrobacter sp.]|nr:hypothetical protein [Arthrobacter sp.]